MIQLENDEKIVYKVHKHWFAIALPVTISIILAAAPLIFFGVFFKFFLEQNISFSLPIFFYCIWLLAIWIFSFVEWTGFYLDVWFVTDRRIIYVDQGGLFNRRISSLRFDKIQDVTIEIKGIIAEMMHFGDISVQTAGENRQFVMHGVENPTKAKELISSVIDVRPNLLK